MNTTPPKLHRRQYWVWMNDPDTGVPGEAQLVETTYSDQLRGELELAKLGLSMAQAPLHVATVWVWCAMVRAHGYPDKFQAFKTRDLAELEPIAQAGDDGQEVPVPDPT